MPLLVSSRQRFLKRYGPWAVVTGASSGIGQACALELARRGLNIVLGGRDPDRLAAIAGKVTGLGVAARTVVQDMGEPGAAGRLTGDTADLDVGLLVAAAGYGDTGPFLDGDPAVLADMLRVNGEAVLLQSQPSCSRAMRSVAASQPASVAAWCCSPRWSAGRARPGRPPTPPPRATSSCSAKASLRS